MNGGKLKLLDVEAARSFSRRELTSRDLGSLEIRDAGLKLVNSYPTKLKIRRAYIATPQPAVHSPCGTACPTLWQHRHQQKETILVFRGGCRSFSKDGVTILSLSGMIKATSP